MNGPAHYLAAEELMEKIDQTSTRNTERRNLLAMQALTHAILAQTAASAPTAVNQADKWAKVIR